MQLFDTHAHLDDALRKGLLAKQMEAARVAGVEWVALPNCDLATLPDVLEACSQYPGRLFAMCGLHPTYIEADVEEQQAGLKNALYQSDSPFVAVGEIGIDLYWKQDNLDQQQQVLHRQMEWAVELGLPVSLHTRNALAETVEVIKPFSGKVKGVFHCFSGTVEEANSVLQLGYYLGIGGNLTYKNNDTIATLQALGLGGVVLETDSPYLAPVPFRGKPNQPAYVRYVAEFLADRLGLTINQVAEITSGNAHTLFSRTQRPDGR